MADLDPIYRVQRREPGAEPITRVGSLHLLTPAEREQAKQDREKKRKQLAKKRPPQVRQGGADYLG
jgi:hypothetical protein